ncbi:MAG: hypothetical protein ACREUM_09355 [Nitrosospira sp.]
MRREPAMTRGPRVPSAGVCDRVLSATGRGCEAGCRGLVQHLILTDVSITARQLVTDGVPDNRPASPGARWGRAGAVASP